MSVHIKALHGREQPVGVVFVSYAHEDQQSVKNIIEQRFIHAGIPYFLDESGIKGGEPVVQKIESALNKASCGVIVLSPQSLQSRWLWFETGVLVGNNTTVIPFMIKVDNRSKFIKELPDFIRRFQIVWDIDDLVSAVRDHIFHFGGILEDEDLAARVASKLKQARITFTLQLNKGGIRDHMTFGCNVVRFGREDTLEHPMNEPLLREATLINKPVPARSISYDEESGSLQVEFILPVHETLGVKFKPYVDVADVNFLGDVESILKKNGFRNVNRSSSPEQQRVYYLLPLDDSLIVTSPDGILDNYLYPL